MSYKHLFTKSFKNGWTYKRKITDTSIIRKVFIQKRMFCFFDKEYPYTLNVEYDVSFAYWLFMEFMSSNHWYHTSYMTFRFKTLKDATFEMNKIQMAVAKNIKDEE